MTKLASTLPQGNANGLESIAQQLVETPETVHVVIAFVDCSKTTTDNDTGDTQPTARIRRVEVVDRADLPRCEQIMRRALDRRMGGTTLPIELEDEISEVFGSLDVDPATGEVLSGGDEYDDGA